MGKIKLRKSEKKKKQLATNEAAVPSECDGYKVMELRSYPLSVKSHHILVKEHSVRERCPEKPPNRTIFIRNIPPFVKEEALRNAFTPFGPIGNIYLHKTPCASLPATNTSTFFTDVPPITGFKVAYVVYENESDAKKVLLAPSETSLVLYPGGAKSPKSFLENMINQYNDRITTDPDTLKMEVNEYMTSHDQRKEDDEKSEKEKREAEEAEDGWVTVTRKTGIPRKESVHNKIMKRRENKMKKTQLLNFYRFQIRESKMSQLVKLREKFEYDKKRITQLKESRKFKPF